MDTPSVKSVKFWAGVLALLSGLVWPPAAAVAQSPDSCPLGSPLTSSQASFEARISSFDGHEVPVSVFLAAGARPAPTILWGHGWAGERHLAQDSHYTSGALFFQSRGYNVVAMDFRGHGEARCDSFARILDPEYEIRDVSAVIDWVAAQPWAALDAADDPVLGAYGVSYGGGFQLLTAIFDGRLDAIVPLDTWNNLAESLGPNDVGRAAWLDLLYSAGIAFVNLDPFIHEGSVWWLATGDFPDGRLPGEPDMKSLLLERSAASYPGRIQIPTLLVQGLPDTLFNLNQAYKNYVQVKSGGGEAALSTHLTGHLLPLLQPGEPDAPFPCGHPLDLALAWYDRHLRGLDTRSLPRVSLALEDGACVSSRHFPSLPFPPTTVFDLGRDAVLFQGVPADPGQRLRIPLMASEEGTVIAGIPRLRGSMSTALAPEGGRVFFSFVLEDLQGASRVLHSQHMPLLIRPSPTPVSFAIELAGLGVRLKPGEILYLEISDWEDQFSHTYQRLPGVVTVAGMALELPVLCGKGKMRRPTAGSPRFETCLKSLE